MFYPVFAGALKPVNVPLNCLDVSAPVPTQDEVLWAEVLTGLLKVEAAIPTPPVELLLQAEVPTPDVVWMAGPITGHQLGYTEAPTWVELGGAVHHSDTVWCTQK